MNGKKRHQVKKEIYWKAKCNECEAKIKEFKKKTINDEKIRNMNELVDIRSEDNLKKKESILKVQ